MHLTRIRPPYLVALWVTVIAIIGGVLYLGYRRNAGDLRELMENEAQRLVNLAAVSATASIHALDEVEYVTEERLFDNARLIEGLWRAGSLGGDELQHVLDRNDLHMIAVLGGDGVVLARVAESDAVEDSLLDHEHRREVREVLDGDYPRLVIGFMADAYYGDQPYGVVLGTPFGAVVVSIDSDRMLAFRKEVGIGTVFDSIGTMPDVQYVALQDTLGIVAASRNVTAMTRINDEPFLQNAYNGGGASRFVGAANRTYEVVRPLVVDGVHLGLLRLGLATSAIDGIMDRAERQFVILFIAAALSGVLLVGYLVLKQNYRLLDSEHDRILREVREMEEEVRRNERLTSMGRLAGGVAHEIRNPLNAVSIISQRLKAEFTPVSDAEEYRSLLSTVKSEIERISSIIEHFLRYARPPALDKKRHRLADLVGEAVSVVSAQAKTQDTGIVVDIPSDILCTCDRDQMQQALLNMLLNAVDAAGPHGRVTVIADSPRSGILLRISDSGPGIPEEHLGNIFDPYFTTKENGTGLGLSEVHRIITAHNGRITVSNSENGGAVFTILLKQGKTDA